MVQALPTFLGITPIGTYLLIVSALLCACAIILVAMSLMHWGKPKPIWTIWLGWVAMLGPAFLCAWLGKTAMILGITLVTFLALNEFLHLTGGGRDRWLVWFLRIFLLLCVGVCVFPDAVPARSYDALVVLAVLLMALIPILRDKTIGQLQLMSLGLWGCIHVIWCTMHLARICNLQNGLMLAVFLICAVELGDIAAYVTGKIFGRKKLRPKISPNKTGAGFLGAILLGLAMPWVMRFVLPENWTWIDRIAIGLILGIGGTLGDLTMSVIKRDAGVKDTGKAIIGHGGVLDRIDSLMLTAPLFYAWITLR